MGRKGWITNPGSQQYKQLEHAVSKMRGEFTSNDVMNFMRERWDTKRTIDGGIRNSGSSTRGYI